MNVRTGILVGVVLLLIVGGMLYYTTLVHTEQAALESSNTDDTPPTPITVQGEQMFTESYQLPLPGSAPTENIVHTIPLTEVRRGCFQQDCIPSIDSPTFVPAASLVDILAPDSLGIVLHDADRFYPFPMLETREIVNDVLPDGRPVAVTYCPLCGTGIVFSRELADGVATEFGVSGMLWQSNLLMYDRANTVTDRNLWSQVLGEAVIGDRAGETLTILASDIITFADWLALSEDGQTLDTGRTADPYNGDYFGTAQFFQPNFDADTSILEPMERVHGIIVQGQPKAYVSARLFDDLTDIVEGERVFVERSGSQTTFFTSNAEVGIAPTVIPDVEGFWFSWVAAHPDTELWIGK